MQSVSERPEAPTVIKLILRQFCLFGTQPLHLADHIACRRARRKMSKHSVQPGTSRRCWRAFRSLKRKASERTGNPFRSSSFRSGSRRLLASSGAAKRGVESHVVDRRAVALTGASVTVGVDGYLRSPDGWSRRKRT